MTPETATGLLARAEQIIILFVVVCLAGAAVVTLDPKAQDSSPMLSNRTPR